MQGLVPDLKKFIQGKLFSDSFFTLLSHLEKSLHRRINAILISIGHFGFFLVIFNHHKHFLNVFLVTAPFYISCLFSSLSVLTMSALPSMMQFTTYTHTTYGTDTHTLAQTHQYTTPIHTQPYKDWTHGMYMELVQGKSGLKLLIG